MAVNHYFDIVILTFLEEDNISWGNMYRRDEEKGGGKLWTIKNLPLNKR